MRRQVRRHAVALRQQHIGHVVNPRRLDAQRPEQALQGQFHHLLRLAHDVGPAAALEQHVERAQARLSPAEMIGSQIAIAHYAAPFQ